MNNLASNNNKEASTKKFTFVVEFEAGKEPEINGATEILGGRLVLVAFKDISENQLSAEKSFDGWKLVPVEPTTEMLNAVLATHVGYKSHGAQRGLLYAEAGNIWARMLAAAPAQPLITWVSVSESLPEKEDGCLMLPCLVRYVWTDCDGNKHYALGEDFFDNDASELGGEWLENDGAVTHWVYMQDLPMPVEPMEAQSQ